MKKTAVKWMANELLHLDHEFDMKLIDKNEYQARRKKVTNQAKEMEKEQIQDAHYIGYIDCKSYNIRSGEQYYNETFKSKI